MSKKFNSFKKLIKKVTSGKAKNVSNMEFDKMNEYLDDLIKSTTEQIIDKTNDIIKNDIPEVMGNNVVNEIVKETNNINKSKVRRKGNKAVKEIPVNNSTQQKQQLLLEAPKKKTSSKKTINQPENGTIQMGETLKLPAPQERPRPPRKKQPNNLLSNTESIQLPGPIQPSPADNKRTIKNRRKGNKTVKEVPVNNSTQQEPQLLLEAPKQKEPRKPRREYKSDLGTNTESIALPGPVKNDISSFDDIGKNLTEQSTSPIYESQVKKIKELYNDGQLTKEQYKESVKNLNDRFNSTPSVDNQLQTELDNINKRMDAKLQNDLDSINEKVPDKAKPRTKDTKIEVSLDDFKTRDEIEQIDASDSLDINVEDLEINNPEPKRVNKSRAEEYANRLEEIDNRYNNGDINDIEYSDELNRLKDIYEKDNPVDVSNVLNDSNKSAFDINDLSNFSIDELEMKKSLWEQKKEDPIFNKKDTYDSNLSRESRIITNEDDFNNEIDTIEQLYNNGDLTDEQYTNELNRTHRQYKPDIAEEANEETKQYIQDQLKQEKNNSDIDNLYSDIYDRKSIISKQENREGYNANVTNGFVNDITIGDETYNFKYRSENNKVYDVFDSNGNLITDEKILEDLNSKYSSEVSNFYKNLSDDEWNTVINNAEDYRFDVNKSDLKSTEKLLNKNDAIDTRQKVLKEKEKYLQNELNTAKGKKQKKKITDNRNKTNVDILQAEKVKQKNKFKVDARNEREAARKAFQDKVKTEGLQKGTPEYEAALKELKANFKNSKTTMNNKINLSDKSLDAQIKGYSGKALTLSKAITMGTVAISAIDKYKESKAEGRSTGSSLIRAAGTAAIGEVLGPGGFIALTAAQAVPKLAINGADALYKEYRRMNSASNFVPLGGVNFQDSQELATMRQSGMELAKMSQYNLEQTLMGAEAKHLHR